MGWLKEKVAGMMAPSPAVPDKSAIPPVQIYTPAEERHARASGFRTADQMNQWLIQRARPTGGTTSSSGSMPDSISQAWHDAMAWHPANTLQYVADAMKNATGD